MPRSATFIVTRRCRENCPACPVELKNSDMPPAVFKKAAGELFRRFPGTELVKFFGGEPLLNFQLVRTGIAHIRSLGLSPRFEVGTNGLLMDAAKAAYFRRRPEVQLNVNAAFGAGRVFAGLPNVIWNLCITPAGTAAALPALKSLAGTARAAGHRVNILPAYYCAWTPAQLKELKAVLRAMSAFIKASGLRLENGERTGSVPLFNDGPAVDTDGKIYRSNLCLARMAPEAREGLLLGSGPAAPVARRDLVKIFGLKAVACAFAADRIMDANAGT